ncbi:MAG: MGMT family protein [Antricoccus sp.]
MVKAACWNMTSYSNGLTIISARAYSKHRNAFMSQHSSSMTISPRNSIHFQSHSIGGLPAASVARSAPASVNSLWRAVLPHLAMLPPVGNPRAVRAAGTACSLNPLPLIIPCHRVVRSGDTAGS